MLAKKNSRIASAEPREHPDGSLEMEPLVVGIREFRARLADFLLKGDRPVTVTRHGATVGYFLDSAAHSVAFKPHACAT
jgi:prevent-host-death family protein